MKKVIGSLEYLITKKEGSFVGLTEVKSGDNFEFPVKTDYVVETIMKFIPKDMIIIADTEANTFTFKLKYKTLEEILFQYHLTMSPIEWGDAIEVDNVFYEKNTGNIIDIGLELSQHIEYENDKYYQVINEAALKFLKTYKLYINYFESVSDDENEKMRNKLMILIHKLVSKLSCKI